MDRNSILKEPRRRWKWSCLSCLLPSVIIDSQVNWLLKIRGEGRNRFLGTACWSPDLLGFLRNRRFHPLIKNGKKFCLLQKQFGTSVKGVSSFVFCLKSEFLQMFRFFLCLQQLTIFGTNIACPHFRWRNTCFGPRRSLLLLLMR